MKKKSDLGKAVQVALSAGELTMMISKAKRMISQVLEIENGKADGKREKPDRSARFEDMGATITPVQPRLIELAQNGGLGNAYAIPVGRKPVVIGRKAVTEKPDVGLDVPNVVSRRHIEIDREGGVYTLTHIAKENVTCVNGRIIPYGQSVTLKDGDLIALSSDGYFFIFRCTATPIYMLPLFTDTDRMLSC